MDLDIMGITKEDIENIYIFECMTVNIPKKIVEMNNLYDEPYLLFAINEITFFHTIKNINIFVKLYITSTKGNYVKYQPDLNDRYIKHNLNNKHYEFNNNSLTFQLLKSDAQPIIYTDSVKYTPDNNESIISNYINPGIMYFQIKNRVINLLDYMVIKNIKCKKVKSLYEIKITCNVNKINEINQLMDNCIFTLQLISNSIIGNYTNQNNLLLTKQQEKSKYNYIFTFQSNNKIESVDSLYAITKYNQLNNSVYSTNKSDINYYNGITYEELKEFSNIKNFTDNNELYYITKNNQIHYSLKLITKKLF
jgi:hypothetical protein